MPATRKFWVVHLEERERRQGVAVDFPIDSQLNGPRATVPDDDDLRVVGVLALPEFLKLLERSNFEQPDGVVSEQEPAKMQLRLRQRI